jgi:hypothetical protein
LQVFEKTGNALSVDIYEGLWFTYMAVDTSRPLAAGTLSGTSSVSPLSPAPISAVPSATLEARNSIEPAPPPADLDRDRPRSAWDSVKDGGVAIGRSVKSFFSTLFSD